MGTQMSFMRGDQGSGRMLAGVLTKDFQIAFYRTPPCRKTKERHTCQEFTTCRQLNLILNCSVSDALILFPEEHSTKDSAETITCCACCVVSRKMGVGFMCTEFQPFAFHVLLTWGRTPYWVVIILKPFYQQGSRASESALIWIKSHGWKDMKEGCIPAFGCLNICWCHFFLLLLM